jgi:PAS domain S-box-containing protein
MALRREITAQITDLLRKNPQGLSITEIVRCGGINRNTAGRYLDNLLVSGQVEMRHFGMAKIYTLSQRLPVSSVLAISSELVMQLDSSLRIVFLNQPFIDLLGKSEKEILGKNIEFSPILSFFDDVFPRVLAWIREGLAGTEYKGELVVPRQNFTFFCRIAPTVFNNGQKGVSVLFEDITRRKRDEARIRESEERLRSIIRVAPIGIGVVSDRILLEVNDQVCSMTGFEAGDLVGCPARKLYARQEEYDRVGKIKYEQIQQTGSGSVETQWQRKDGTIIDVLLSSTPLNHADPEAGVTFTALDITERQRAGNALRESEERFRKLVEISPDAVILHREGKIIYVNHAAIRLLGARRESDIVGKDVLDFIHPHDRDIVRTNIKKDLTGESTPSVELQMLRIDGTPVFVEGRGVSTSIGGNSAVLVALNDITLRKVKEEALRESEARYRSLSEASQDLIFVVDCEDRVLYLNQKAAAFLQVSAEAAIGEPRSRFFPADISSRQSGALRQVFSTGQPVRSEGPMKIRNEVLWFDHALVPIPDAEGRVASVLGVSRDITNRINAEKEIRENELKYRFIAEHSVDIINRQTPECICTYTSPSVTALLGYAEQDVLGTSVLAMVHPDDLPGVLRDMEVIRNSSLESVTSAFRFRHKKGHYLWFESTTRIIRDEAGQVREFLSISRDITGRMRDHSPENGPAGKGSKKRGIRME